MKADLVVSANACRFMKFQSEVKSAAFVLLQSLDFYAEEASHMWNLPVRESRISNTLCALVMTYLASAIRAKRQERLRDDRCQAFSSSGN